MKKILCPIDFSENSLNATAYAAKVAQCSNADLVLFHEHSLWNFSPEEVLSGRGTVTMEIAEELELRCRQISQAFHITCYADVVSSGRTLVSLLEEFSDTYDLVVMWLSTARDIGQFVFGSRAFQVSRLIEVPLLFVPENYTFKMIERIAFAFDPSDEHETGIDQLTKWAEIWKAKVALLEGVNKNMVLDTAASDKTRHGGNSIEVLTIDKKHLIDELHSYMMDERADLLALHARHHGFFESLLHKSVIRAMTGKAMYPVFIFHR